MQRLLLFIFILLSVDVSSQGFLKTRGGSIVDGQGKEVILRGMGLGGLMLHEHYLLKLSEFAIAQHDIRK
jgi:hypothetical protein